MDWLFRRWKNSDSQRRKQTRGSNIKPDPLLSKERFKIGRFCPGNENNIHLSLKWIEETTHIDWAIIFLGIGGGYLKYSDVFQFALKQFDENSDRFIEQLALMSYENSPNHKDSDLIIQTIIKDIDKETWAVAFLRLFFSTLKWFCNYAPLELNDYQIELENLCYDFDELEIEDDTTSFPYLSVCNIVQDVSIKEAMREKYEMAADKYLSIVNRPQSFKRETEMLLDIVYIAWRLHDNL